MAAPPALDELVSSEGMLHLLPKVKSTQQNFCKAHKLIDKK